MTQTLDRGVDIPILVPAGLLATIKAGSPVRVGGSTGFNAVLTTDPKPATEATTDTVGPAFAGGNKPGYASATREGVHQFTVSFAVATMYAPVYIVVSTGALTSTDNSGANPQFGWAMNVKTAAEGALNVLIKSN